MSFYCILFICFLVVFFFVKVKDNRLKFKDVMIKYVDDFFINLYVMKDYIIMVVL